MRSRDLMRLAVSKMKKEVRRQFREAVFNRDQHKCRVCGNEDEPLDAHHITDRNLMPNGGYVPENGISLCPQCHRYAESQDEWVAVRNPYLTRYAPDELYLLIGSSHCNAVVASEKLGT